MRVLDVIADQTTPAGSVDFSYTVVGYTVDGYVKDGDGILYALALLYRQGVSGDEFAGFAQTDHTGKYEIYQVPVGTYRVATIARDYDDTEWSSTFDVVAANVTVPDILMGGKLVADFGLDGVGADGIWTNDGTTWSKIANSDPENLVVW